MGFSTATITHQFSNADGTPASGVIKFTLTQSMTNSGSTVNLGSVTSSLDSGGNLSQVLTANNDPGTVSPTPAQWRVDIDILGEATSDQSFFITVPTGGGTVDLGTLMPGNQQVS